MAEDAPKRNTTLSLQARYLLNKEEGNDVDFKRNRSGLKSEDLVAFANSPTGGTILIGVDEEEDATGKQRGKVVGCKIGDGEKLAIISKATSCRPPIDLQVFVETTEDGLSFYRIEIPSGQYKPYCTDKGIYMIRGDGRNVPLTPDRLLDLYVEVQGSQFLNRFRQATTDLERKLQQSQKELKALNKGLYQVKERISKELSDHLCILQSVVVTTEQIEKKLNDIFNQASHAEKLSDDALNFSIRSCMEMQLVSQNLEKMKREVTKISEKMNDLLVQIDSKRPASSKGNVAPFFYKTDLDREKVRKKLKNVSACVEEDII